MPEGKLGKIVGGRFIPLTIWSQKHLGHSRKREIVEGDNTNGFISMN
jgi:hypothetical protein